MYEKFELLRLENEAKRTSFEAERNKMEVKLRCIDMARNTVEFAGSCRGSVDSIVQEAEKVWSFISGQ